MTTMAHLDRNDDHGLCATSTTQAVGLTRGHEDQTVRRPARNRQGPGADEPGATTAATAELGRPPPPPPSGATTAATAERGDRRPPPTSVRRRPPPRAGRRPPPPPSGATPAATDERGATAAGPTSAGGWRPLR